MIEIHLMIMMVMMLMITDDDDDDYKKIKFYQMHWSFILKFCSYYIMLVRRNQLMTTFLTTFKSTCISFFHSEYQ